VFLGALIAQVHFLKTVVLDFSDMQGGSLRSAVLALELHIVGISSGCTELSFRPTYEKSYQRTGPSQDDAPCRRRCKKPWRIAESACLLRWPKSLDRRRRFTTFVWSAASTATMTSKGRSSDAEPSS